MALRMSIGAGRGRLIRQMLIESGLLALAACLGALLCSYFAGPAIVAHLGPSDFPVYLDLRPDGRLLTFLLGIGTLATLLFGLLPAWRASAVSPATTLAASNATTPFAAAFLQPLFTVQISVGFVVLFFSGLFITSFQKLDHVELGFPTRSVALWTITGAGDPAAANTFLEAVRKWPGVQAAGFSSCSFVDPITSSAMIFPPDNAAADRIAHIGIGPGFLGTMSIPIAQGRDLLPTDIPAANPENVIVNEAFVRRFLAGRSPLGAHYERRTPGGRLRQTIIGVVPDAHYVDTRATGIPVVFVPNRAPGHGILTIRGTETADPALWQSRLETEFPQLRLAANSSYPAILHNRSLRDRLLAWLSVFLAVLTVAVVILGLQGVLGYALARRQQELALRLAVGAPVPRVVAEVFRSTARVTALGVLIGVAISIALTPLVTPLLFQSPSLLTGLAFPLAAIAAAWTLTAVPVSSHIARINPAHPLRQQ